MDGWQNGAAAPRVIGFGDNVVDRYLDRGVFYPGGNALNFAVYARMIGARAAYLGVFGDDRHAAHIGAVLAELDVATERCHHETGENGYADVRLVDGNRTFVFSNQGGVSGTKPFVPDAGDLAYLAGFDLVHTSATSHLDDRLPAIRAAVPRLSYDLSWRWRLDGKIEAVCPHVDAVAFSCGDHPGAAEALLERAAGDGCGVAIATLGKDGALARSGGTTVFAPSAATSVVDTLGAGDAFLTACLLSLVAAGWRRGETVPAAALTDALTAGAAFAARACQFDGAFGHGARMTADGVS
jgi:sugar/nucleoside kinase (ribokinase family)